MDPKLLALAPTAIENVYHVGHLVPDLRSGMAAFGRRLQLTWATPFQMPSGFERADGEPDSDDVRIAFSIEGPPFLELIEVVPRAGSIFAEPAGGGFHHIGFYAERWRDEVARLTADGMELERRGAGVAFVRDPALGIRFEVVSFKGRDFLTKILSGEMGATHPLSDSAEQLMSPAVARTSSGDLRGVREGALTVFRGVPFAAPPIDDRRWRSPRPADPWPGVRDATTFGAIAPQDISPERLAKRSLAMSEDCLSLNVWTPGADGDRLPVVVFLHGGGVVAGSGSAALLDGCSLATRGHLVVVTVNFRLGALGSLYAPERLGTADDRATNLAFRDQLLALRWVREEIGAFGGDPGNVTVMGQSSGAVAIACMLAGDAAPGLFDRAILQSGGLERVRSTEAAGAVGRQFFAALGVEDELDRRRPRVEDVLAAQAQIPTGFVPPVGPFHHAVDGELIIEHPLVTAGRRPMLAVPILAGTTRDEWRAFDVVLDDDTVTDRFLRDRARALAGDHADVEAILSLHRSEQSAPDPIAHRRAVASALVTDFHFAAPTEQFVRAHAAAGNRAYRYELQWPSPRPGLGACHDTCLPLVFGTMATAPGLVGTGHDVTAMSAVVQDTWIAFIRSGDPSTAAVGAWAPYDEDRRPTMLLGPEPQVVDRHREELLAVWDGRYPASG